MKPDKAWYYACYFKNKKKKANKKKEEKKISSKNGEVSGVPLLNFEGRLGSHF